MKEAPGSSETSVLTRATRRNNPEDTILHSSTKITSDIGTSSHLHKDKQRTINKLIPKIIIIVKRAVSLRAQTVRYMMMVT
jgi:hypothetical protein